jgi:predicted metal-dependent phosphoesterase TrpH
MEVLIDLHVHTRRYSECSNIDPFRLVGEAVRVGLDGLVLTEHHHQWEADALEELLRASGHPDFLLFSAMEYTSEEGDILVYGLSPETANAFPAFESAGEVVARVRRMGGLCVAAHPTRSGFGFDSSIREIPFDGIEVRSVNLQPHEQQLAGHLAGQLGLPGLAGSDAHRLEDVGTYATAFDAPVRSMADLKERLRHGRFKMTEKLR